MSDRPCTSGILVLDYGSQYTLLIARRLRELGVYAEVIPGSAERPPQDFEITGIILSGGPDSVTTESARSLPAWVLRVDRPVLGICYGMQLLAIEYGGRLRAGESREYGRTEMQISQESLTNTTAKALFSDLTEKQNVWMSHGDDVEELPKDFAVVSKTRGGVIAAAVHRDLPVAGLQFHPEVQHTTEGAKLLGNFVERLCGKKPNWRPQDMLAALTKQIQEDVGGGQVLMAVSGGVDSTVAAVLLAKSLGSEHVTAVFVDHGLLRKGEAAWVEENLRTLGIKKLEVLHRADLFLGRLEGISDPEEKRKIIGRSFIEVFEEYAASHAREFTHLGQGTLYPDVIESAGDGSGAKVIKSHHNVGGLPEKLKLHLAEPFRFLFKDEVRRIGVALGIAHDLVYRHPFPGPGLGIRIPGEISREKISILQEADAIYVKALRDADLYSSIWQAFTVLLPVKSVGVMGDNRTYQYACCIRAVSATDGMTADVSPLPMDFLTGVADQIVRKVDGINRVLYDVTTKPPATIEWE